MATSSTEPIVYSFWDLSTRHITLSDTRLLLDSPCLIVYEHECGWTVLVPQDDLHDALSQVAQHGHSTALRSLLRLAHQRDIRMIRFDRDGDLVAGLKQFDW
ncbi:MAG: hypothetical protein RIC55_20395 [Pirellulaceae bacterium]